MFVFALLFLVKALKKPYKICFSVAIFSLCLYSYGSAYVAVPIFLLLSVIFIIKNKLITIKWISIAFAIFVIMSIPIGLFIIINKFGLNSIHLGPITIPSMAQNTNLYESLGIAIKYADSITEDQTVYVTNDVTMPYIYILFYTKENPHEYINTVKFEEGRSDFLQVESFGKWEFNTEGYEENKPGIYIIENEKIDAESNNNIVKFKNYSVVTIE